MAINKGMIVSEKDGRVHSEAEDVKGAERKAGIGC